MTRSATPAGGIRLPDLEVPTARHSGTIDRNPLAALLGQSTPLAGLRAEGLLLDEHADALRQRGRTIAVERWPS